MWANPHQAIPKADLARCRLIDSTAGSDFTSSRLSGACLPTELMPTRCGAVATFKCQFVTLSFIASPALADPGPFATRATTQFASTRVKQAVIYVDT